MSERRARISIPGAGDVTAIITQPAGDAAWTFVYAPGAGSNIHDPFGAHLCRALAARGVRAARFQFPYMEAGRRAPDRPALLLAAWRAAIGAFRPARGRLCAGGRSMGGRIASMAVAEGARVDALALFAYPLHPPGRPEQCRVEHLPSVRARTLFVSGTNDSFASPTELAAAAALVRRARVHLLAAADHGFAAPRASGRTKEEIFGEATDALIRFLRPGGASRARP